MHTIEIQNFKAFGAKEIRFGPSKLDFTKRPKNILCYGDNGTGKSSVFDAILWAFFSDKIISSKVSNALIGEERNNAIRQLQLMYNNTVTNVDFSLKINGEDYKTFDNSEYYVYMFRGDSLSVTSHISMFELYGMAMLGGTSPISILSNGNLNIVIAEVNRVLKDVFFEPIQIEESQNEEGWIVLKDEIRGISKDSELPLFFNEAKIHLVKLLLLLSSIELLAPQGETLHRVLVLDDIFTSLDSSNRLFIFQYLAEHFSRFQIILLTHNVNFFNLAEHLINNHYKSIDKWAMLSLYEANNEFKLYEKSQLSTKIIRTWLRTGKKTDHDIGNDIRQYFEILLHQLAVLTMIDAKEESKIILSDIYSSHANRNFYITGSYVKSASEVLSNIKDVLANVPKEYRLRRILGIVNRFYTNEGGKELIPTLEAMTLFQKVALHKSSHGHAGLPDLQSTEIRTSLIILERLEKLIAKINMERV